MNELDEDTEAPGRSRHREPDATLPLGLVDDVPIDHDPLNPHPEHPTPIELVVRLPRPQREKRVERLIEMSHARFREALTIHGAGKNIAAVCALRSGGNDSEAVTHLFRDVTTHHVHANTGTGIEATRQFVRDTAGVPLLEFSPPAGKGYRELVLGLVTARSRETGQLVRAWPGGFPGPAAHAVMQQRLKGRALEQVPRTLGISGSRTDRVVFIAGRRRSESKRRGTVPHHETKGTVIWSSPIAVWHKADLRTYRLMHPEIPRNPVAQTLGMSGECGCLANATAGEPQRWFDAYPDDPWLAEVREMEGILDAEYYCDSPLCPYAHLHAGVLNSDGEEAVPSWRRRWGWGSYIFDDTPVPPMRTDSLCGPNCGPDPLLDLMDPLFALEAS